MLPKNAMPSAPPSSAHVSEIPEAAPARSGGAEPMMTSLVSVNSGDPKNVNTNVATANRTNPPLPVPTGERRRQERADHESHRPRQRPEPAAQRRQSEHKLQVLR